MPLFLIRAKYATDSYQSLAQAPLDRRPIIEQNLNTAGLTLIEMYFQPSAAEWLFIVNAEVEDAGSGIITGMSTGGFQDLKYELLLSSDQMLQAAQKAHTRRQKFKPPNQDEIDRMLLDE